ncbi:MAG: hypothetical protein D6725_00420 [Planctomycetota bacterium]|nr:MAG: hypothetical protein D6725_00420 [Planctomycetota bacterium]
MPLRRLYATSRQHEAPAPDFSVRPKRAMGGAATMVPVATRAPDLRFLRASQIVPDAKSKENQSSNRVVRLF